MIDLSQCALPNSSDLPTAGLCNHGLPARRPLSLRILFRANRIPILASYALFMLENSLRLAQPLVLGLAINDLLNQSYRGLAWFIAQHLSHMLIGSLRQVYDTRVFAGIYRDLASEMVVAQRDANIDISRIAARSAMSRAYIEFFERHVPTLIRASWSVVGGMAMLYFYDPELLPWSVARKPTRVSCRVKRSRTIAWSS